MGDDVELYALNIAESLRDAMPTLRVQTHFGGGNFKKQMKRADKSAARVALVLGETEQQEELVSIKFLREDKPQIQVARSALESTLAELFSL
jgi:histidyl-tRNA synthetase